MKNVAAFIVEKRKVILTVFVLFTLVSVWLLSKVVINFDMTKYLPDNSPTKIGIDIMDNEFPAASSVNVMFEGLNENEKIQIYDELSKIENIQTVTYEAESDKHNKDGYTLYNVTMPYNAYGTEAKSAVEDIREKFLDYDIVLSGEAAGNSALSILPLLVIPALIILFVILFLMCNSWFEPLLFLFNIAVAIAINMGTNVIFENVSEITQSISAILQLVLSMDYSIMLMNRYRQEKKLTGDKFEAMKGSLVNAFTAISSSSITTIVGMLMLLFMSFTIGTDLGLVLAKGILLSLICIFTVLPAMILMFDNMIEKTAKPSLHLNMNKLASFGYSGRYFVLAVFIVLFVVGFLLRGSVAITYSMADFDKVYRVFKLNNPIVVLYENNNESKIEDIVDKWSDNTAVDSINAYSTTLGKKMTYKELAASVSMDETLVALMYAGYDNDKVETPEKKITLGNFIEFLKNDVATNELFSTFFTDENLAQLDAIGAAGTEQLRLSSEEFALFSGMDTNISEQIFNFYFVTNGQTEDGKVSIDELVQFLMTNVATNEQFAPLFTEDIFARVSASTQTMDNSVLDQELSSDELAGYINMDADVVKQLYTYYDIVQGEVPANEIAIYDFIQYITTNVANNKQYEPYFSNDILEMLGEAETEMNDGLKHMVGANYSRIIINTDFPEESKETYEFIENIEKDLKGAADGEYFIIGNSAMAYEMSKSFGSELNFITILTAISIFLVVAIAFRSISIPLILVCVIQCAIFMTMDIAYIQGNSIFYLPLLIVQCLLMGATIDYGILYTSYYVEARSSMGVKDAVAAALNNAIHTILTSGLILFTITLVLGLLFADTDHSLSEILLILARGSFCAGVLVVFILPSLLAVFDKFVCKKKSV